MSVKNYSFSNYIINLKVGDTVVNLTKRSTGDFSINQRDEAIFSKRAMNDGEVIFSKRINKSGSISITYSQVSSACNYLDNLFKQAENGDVIPNDISMEILDVLGNKQWEMIDVMMEKPADENFSQTVGNRSYNFLCGEVTKTSIEIE